MIKPETRPKSVNELPYLTSAVASKCTSPPNAKLQYNHLIRTIAQDHQSEKSRALAKMLKLYHTPRDLSPYQCSAVVVHKIDAPLPLVWSVVRRFDHPQAYKKFVKTCILSTGDGGAAGSVRELEIVSGLPAKSSIERLDRLDDDLHVMVVSNIGGDHRLSNYRSTVTLHEDDGVATGDKTVLIESYVVDIPEGNCREDTCLFADTIIGCNLRALANMTEKMASTSSVKFF